MISQLGQEEFIAAWHASSGETFSQKMARKSLMSLARREPELEPLLAELDGGSRQQLDMRLTGKQADDHWAPADLIGDIFKDLAEAVKELAKGIAGKERWKSRLMTSAPAPGSLNLSFATEAAPRQLTLDSSNLGSPDDQALVQLGQLFAAAAAGSETLPGAARHIRNNAAIPVRRVAGLLVDQGWKADFKVYGPLHSTARFTLDTAASQELIALLKVEEEIVTPVTVQGIVDGWRWSEGSLYLIPDHGPKFSAAVPVGLQHEVARLAAHKELRIEAQFNKVEVNNIHQRRAKRTSYELVSISEVQNPESSPTV